MGKRALKQRIDDGYQWLLRNYSGSTLSVQALNVYQDLCDEYFDTFGEYEHESDGTYTQWTAISPFGSKQLSWADVKKDIVKETIKRGR